MTGIGREKDPEKLLLEEELPKLRTLLKEQCKQSIIHSLHIADTVILANMITVLEADLGLFRRSFNQRILYFRQLQEISDCKHIFNENAHTAVDKYT